MTDSEAIQLLARELCPDPTTAALTPGGVADVLISRVNDLEARLQVVETALAALGSKGFTLTGPLALDLAPKP